MTAATLTWERGDRMQVLARLGGTPASAAGAAGNGAGVEHSVPELAAALGFAPERVRVSATGRLDRALGGHPGIVERADGRLVAIAAARGNVAWVVPADPGGNGDPTAVRPVSVAANEMARLLFGEESAVGDDLLKEAGIDGSRRQEAAPRLAALLCEQGPALWRLAPRELPPFPLRQGIRDVAIFAATAAAATALWVISWASVVRPAFAAQLEGTHVALWLLLVATALPLQALATVVVSRIVARYGGWLRMRLLAGSLALDADRMRAHGVGAYLGIAIEAAELESLSLLGALGALVAAAELAAALVVLSLAPRGPILAAALVVFTAGALLAGRAYHAAFRRWTIERLALTARLVDAVLGHATLLAQVDPERFAAREDGALAGYVRTSRTLDRAAAALETLVPRGWLTLGLALLGAGVVAWRPPDADVAVALGGILLGHAALATLAPWLSAVVGAAVAAERLRPLLAAPPPGEAGAAGASLLLRRGEPRNDLRPSGGTGEVVLHALDLSHRYPDRQLLAAADVSLDVHDGARLRLSGPSGSGKSTLASLLAGLRTPATGVLLLRGLDRATLGGPTWRRLVTLAPQHHEGHVFSESLAFNLLLARRWPPFTEDLAEATAVCQALGLGDLLSRMPSGIMQRVGDGGWQLSHGEQSRVALARLLLARPDVLILDETLAPLDGVTRLQCLRVILDRARSLVLVAH